ncbi:MAG: hypothetical protein ACRCVT_00680 [Leadbetterella sp.]
MFLNLEVYSQQYWIFDYTRNNKEGANGRISCYEDSLKPYLFIVKNQVLYNDTKKSTDCGIISSSKTILFMNQQTEIDIEENEVRIGLDGGCSHSYHFKKPNLLQNINFLKFIKGNWYSYKSNDTLLLTKDTFQKDLSTHYRFKEDSILEIKLYSLDENCSVLVKKVIGKWAVYKDTLNIKFEKKSETFRLLEMSDFSVTLTKTK